MIARKKSLRQYCAEKRARLAKEVPLAKTAPRAGTWPQMRNGTLQRSKVPMKRVGPRTLKRQAMNRQLAKLGIDHCEIRQPGCWGRNSLTWAHSRKSRFLVTDTDWLTAARACLHCHRIIEQWSHMDMEAIVLYVIANRPTGV